MNNQEICEYIAQVGIVPVVRAPSPELAVRAAQALLEGGVSVLEITMTVPDAVSVVALLSARFAERALVGAGTVLSAAQVQQVHAAGGRLIVAPNFNADVVREAVRLGMACLPGVFTASEAFAALEAGATAIKLFPAEMIPPAGVKALRAVLPPDTLVLPVGGITPGNMAQYRAAGANGFGIGSALYKPGASAAQVEQRALDFAAAWAGTMRA
jgi:2-dehydro-3-deoxyphosphogalactonate aldolase